MVHKICTLEVLDMFENDDYRDVEFHITSLEINDNTTDAAVKLLITSVVISWLRIQKSG